ncbi:MAG TPA: ATP-binding protein [Elusimicrobiota bacterium]|nr:ATP-binding protein [Elusimicrobiota bacterium]
MDILIIGLMPLLFLLLAATMLMVSQTSGFFQFGRHRVRERSDRAAADRFLAQIALSKSEIAFRNRRLVALSRRLKLNNAELSRLNSLRTKFFSMVTHDIRTPLTAITGYGRMLESRGSLVSDDKRKVSNIIQASEHIGRLVEDLTDLAVIEAGKLRLEPSPFEISEFMKEVARQIAPAAERKGVLFFCVEPPVKTTLSADRFRLSRVLLNLLGNAVKFTPPGGRVDLKVSVMGQSVTFQVRDTGAGIHPSERLRVFEKFYQSDFAKDAGQRREGWGLGLSISEEIVAAHGGRMGVESAGLGRGSTFWARLPLSPRRATLSPAAIRPALASRILPSSVLLCLLLLSATTGLRAQQTIPLNEKASFEKTLDQRADAILLKILGPNRSNVLVDADIDFTRIEKVETKSGEAPNPAESYLWNSGQESASNSPEILPGVPVQPQAQAAELPQSYERENTYPANFVKRLHVTLVLDYAVPEATVPEIENVITNVLNLNPQRGDTLTLVRAKFAPLWKTVWYSPQTASMLIKYILLSLLSLITLTVVALCFLKLAKAMDEMARAQMQQITMDFKGPGAGAAESLPPPTDDLAELEKAELPRLGAPQPGLDLAQEQIIFNVRAEQLDVLADMVKGEDPGNIAILASHLPPDLLQRFLKILPPKATSQVMTSLFNPRFVEPEMILSLKEEVERRLSGTIGGPQTVVQMVQAAGAARRVEMLEDLAKHDPAMAEQIRNRIFLLEDIRNLSHDEWSHLLSRVRLDEMAAALSQGPQSVKDALKQNVTAGTWRVIEETTARYVSDGPARRTAQIKLEEEVAKLVEEGLIDKENLRKGREQLAAAGESPA